VLEEALVPVQVVAPYPVTVTQRNCFELFGLSRADYLKLVAAGAFPVRAVKQLRIASFDDVKAYLTRGAEPRPRARRREKEPEGRRETGDPIADLDLDAALKKAGFRWDS
jgi:hypothetical protein